MLPSLGRWQRLALALSLSLGYTTLHGHTHLAYAEGDDEEEGGGGDGGDGGEGDPKGGEEGDEPEEEDKDQPAVTAGGLFTLKTYPQRENSRPLTMTQGVGQIRAALGTDLSAKGAFGSAGLNLEAVYGYKDNFMLVGGMTNAYNFKSFSFYAGFEGSIVYDLLDIRLAANFHRFAVPRFCGSDKDAPASCAGDANAVLPSGNYDGSKAQFSIDLGFPFRYAIKPEIAIVALQTLFSIDFNGAKIGTPAAGRPQSCLVAGDGTDPMSGADPMNCVQNGAKPDFNPSIGIATNPIPQLSVTIFAQLRIPDFDTSLGNFQVPVTGRIEFSPTQKMDVGLEFTLLNVKPPDPQSPIDNRYVSLFAQARFGK